MTLWTSLLALLPVLSVTCESIMELPDPQPLHPLPDEAGHEDVIQPGHPHEGVLGGHQGGLHQGQAHPGQVLEDDTIAGPYLGEVTYSQPGQKSG